MLTLGMVVIFAGLVIALVAVWRKPKTLKRTDLAQREEMAPDFENDRRAALRRARSIRPTTSELAAIADELDDLPSIGGANQARMKRERQATRTGTIYVPPPESETMATPTDRDYLANVIQMQSVASATTPEHHAHAPTAEPSAPAHDTSSNHHDHSPSVDTHCHSSSSDCGSGGGFDGGGGGHHGH